MLSKTVSFFLYFNVNIHIIKLHYKLHMIHGGTILNLEHTRALLVCTLAVLCRTLVGHGYTPSIVPHIHHVHLPNVPKKKLINNSHNKNVIHQSKKSCVYL